MSLKDCMVLPMQDDEVPLAGAEETPRQVFVLGGVTE